jgi:hypothetical protein
VGQPYGPWGIGLGIVGPLVAQRGFPTALMLLAKERVLEGRLAARGLLFSLGALTPRPIVAVTVVAIAISKPPTGPPLFAS